ncbi:MAG: helix-turn-helix domain-containing protein [Saprospiraceae bacterium]|nr:helix-turn-helix domain-containing protein [Candidatus Brachybacter algidus]MBL0119927.1 helix-turn-helix domain-containing protein [Candidatus Brachybacter algidus]
MNSSISANFKPMQTLEINESFELACRFINETNESIFVTGNAGTGKTSFLKYIINNSPKNILVAAPTGIAALNAGGVTLHSLFQLPFAPFIPTDEYKAELNRNIRQNKKKLDLLRNMDVLVIDEISMVRCDVLDAIDTMLRSVRRNHRQAFGGVQLLFIGDLSQLSPVAKQEEWQLLSKYYKSPYFFESKVVEENRPICIEFTKIYRQKEESFIELLNKVRNNALTPQDVALLNKNYQPDFIPFKDDKYITLTSHNARADRANQSKLEELNTKAYTYTAEIEDDFPEYLYPNDFNLVLKVGAQVMFIKNDNMGRKYFNGKIGVVHSCTDDNVVVDCEGEKIYVGRDFWENTKYSITDGTSTVEQKVLGRYLQFPLKLAWAITIHKSQGLTFDKVMIDAAFSFSSGQVYVALSRCTSLAGIVLLSRIDSNAIVYDSRIKEGVNKLTFQGQIDKYLQDSKQKYAYLLMAEMLDCSDLLKFSNFMHAEIRKVVDKFSKESLPEAEALRTSFTNQQIIVDKFLPSLRKLSDESGGEAGLTGLNQRLNDALKYFLPHHKQTLSNILENHISTELKDLSSKVTENLNELYQLMSLKVYLMEKMVDNFSIVTYLNAKTGYAPPAKKLSVYNNEQKAGSGSDMADPGDHNLLYLKLKKWRDELCKSIDIPIYLIGNQEVFRILSTYMPQNESELLKVKGFGKAKVNRYGEEILGIIKDYCDEFDIVPDRRDEVLDSIVPAKRERKIRAPSEKKVKVDTRMITLQMLQEEKSIPQIAEERNLAQSTIEGHIAHLIGEQKLSIYDYVEIPDIEDITKAIKGHLDLSLNELKQKLPDRFTFGQLRAVKGFLEITKD